MLRDGSSIAGSTSSSICSRALAFTLGEVPQCFMQALSPLINKLRQGSPLRRVAEHLRH